MLNNYHFAPTKVSHPNSEVTDIRLTDDFSVLRQTVPKAQPPVQCMKCVSVGTFSAGSLPPPTPFPLPTSSRRSTQKCSAHSQTLCFSSLFGLTTHPGFLGTPSYWTHLDLSLPPTPFPSSCLQFLLPSIWVLGLSKNKLAKMHICLWLTYQLSLGICILAT